MKAGKLLQVSVIYLQLLLALAITIPAQAQPHFRVAHSFFGSVTIYASATLADGGTVSCGIFLSPDGLIVATNKDGSIRWVKTLEVETEPLYLYSVRESGNGSIIVSGLLLTGPQYYLPAAFCFSPSGTLLWYKFYELGASGYFRDAYPTGDGGYLFVGSRSTGLMVKTDSLGVPRWSLQATFKDQSIKGEYIRLAERADSSFIILAALHLSPIGVEDPSNILSITSVSDAGNIKDQVFIKDTAANLSAQTILSCSNGDIMLGGSLDPFSGFNTPLLVRLSPNGAFKWATTASAFASMQILSLLEEPQGSVIGLSGPVTSVNTDALSLLEIGENGNVLDAALVSRFRPFFGALSMHKNNPTAYSLVLTTFDTSRPPAVDVSNFTMPLIGCNTSPALVSTSPIQLIDTVLEYSHEQVPVTVLTNIPLKIDSITVPSFTLCSSDNVEPVVSLPPMAPYPNPVQSDAPITIDLPDDYRGSVSVLLKDITGRTVYTSRMESRLPDHHALIPTSGLTAGVYAIELLDTITSAILWHGKVIVE